jgi:hypothetical protein
MTHVVPTIHTEIWGYYTILISLEHIMSEGKGETLLVPYGAEGKERSKTRA